MKVYKYKSISDKKNLNRDIESLKQNEIYAPNFKNLNDKFEANFDEIVSDIVNLLQTTFQVNASDVKKSLVDIISYKEKLGVFCLSKTCFSETLWAYYATDNKGYCIEYDFDKLKVKTKDCDYSTELKIKYTDKKPLISVTDMNSKNLIPKMFATKKKVWKHEKEMRILFDSVGSKKLHESAITAIYFGCDASDKLIERIISELSSREISFYRMIVNSQENKFKKKLIRKNTKEYKYNIDNFKYKLVKTVDSTAISYYILLEDNYNTQELQQLALGFKERNFYKPSTIYFIDNLEVLEVVERYPKTDSEYLKFAESIVADFIYSDNPEIYEYPFKDSRYMELMKN